MRCMGRYASVFFFSSRRRHTRWPRDWSSDVCSSDLLATPMSIMVGVGRGAQVGVLIKNAEALERMEKIDTLVVDKTGTLTEGKPKVVAVVAAKGFHENDALRWAASVEKASEHPLALAIVAAAQERKLNLSAVTEFDSP